MSAQTAFKSFVTKSYKCVVRFVYNVCSSFRKTDKNKAIFVLSRSKKLDGNLKYVHDELIKQQPNVKIQFVYAANKLNLKLFKEVIFLSNATYLIVDDYYLPIYLINPTETLKVIQLWHAAGAFKKFGYSTINTKFGPSSSYLKIIPIHSNYTHVYVSSSRVVSCYAEAFNMSEARIFPIGLPRIDLFSKKETISNVKKTILREFPNGNKSKTVNVLVAPTYRAHGRYQESKINFVDLLIDISKHLDDHVQIIFKLHPYMKDEEIIRLDGCANIMLVSKYSLNDWMLVADAFVTDYSSAVFDYSILQRPLAHYVPDIDEYVTSRGLYEDIDVISDGAIISDQQELAIWINARKKNEHYNTERMIAYNFDHTKNVSSKIVSHFTRD